MFRPYLNKPTAELHRLFLAHECDRQVLCSLRSELAHRRRPLARALLAKICERIGALEREEPTPARLQSEPPEAGWMNVRAEAGPFWLQRLIVAHFAAFGEIMTRESVRSLRSIVGDRHRLEPSTGSAASLGIFNEAQFERALQQDAQDAHESIVIFSAFITAQRARSLAELLAPRTAEGVKVRCVTRPPRRNGTIPRHIGEEAIATLEAAGAVVDCRSRIHQKACFIDRQVVWFGSLNALSHMYLADETMSRVVDAGFAAMLAAHLCRRELCAEQAIAIIADRENPPCPACGGRTVLDEQDTIAPFHCEARCVRRNAG